MDIYIKYFFGLHAWKKIIKIDIQLIAFGIVTFNVTSFNLSNTYNIIFAYVGLKILIIHIRLPSWSCKYFDSPCLPCLILRFYKGCQECAWLKHILFETLLRACLVCRINFWTEWQFSFHCLFWHLDTWIVIPLEL